MRTGPGHQALVACRADMVALCSGVEVGGGRKFNCLAQNREKLSPGCQAAIQTVLAKNGSVAVAAEVPPGPGGPPTGRPQIKVHQICRADIASVCAGVEKGQGRIAKCLNENSAKLSPPCQSGLSQRKAERQMLRRDVGLACARDRQNVCGAGLKGHEVLVCLRQAQAKLSEGCQQALAKLN